MTVTMEEAKNCQIHLRHSDKDGDKDGLDSDKDDKNGDKDCLDSVIQMPQMVIKMTHVEKEGYMVIKTTQTVMKIIHMVIKMPQMVIKTTQMVMKITHMVIKMPQMVIKTTQTVIKTTQTVIKTIQMVKKYYTDGDKI